MRLHVAVVALTSLAVLAPACAVTVSVEVPANGVAAPDEESGTASPPAGDGSDVGDGVFDGDVVVAGRFTWRDDGCEFVAPAGVASDCGWLEVPERWDDPTDPDTVRLHVGVFSAGPSDEAPVVYLEGGPGGDALINIAQSFTALFGTLVDTRDVVILGQRGTGSAEPSLTCENVNELTLDLLDEPQPAADELDVFADAYVECAGDLRAAGIDTGAYNSVQNAHDVEALRQALGHEQWDVLGISYGTRLAQTLMRLHPEGVRAVILDSVLAYERQPTLDIPTVAKRAFETFFAECAASAVCSAAWPDLETRFFDLVDRLDDEPVFFEVANVFDGRRFPAALNGTGLLDTAFGALYSKPSFSGLPELVEQLEQGDTSGIETLASQDVTTQEFFAEGMYWSVECHEEVPFVDLADGSIGRTGDPRYDRMQPDNYGAFIGRLCGAFDAGSAPPVENELLVSDIPALLLAGRYDPITPPADTASLLEGLARGQYVEFPHTGHAAMTEECAQRIAVAFLDDPTAAVDAACVSDTDEPDWAPDIFADLAFESFEYDAGFYSASGVAPVGWEAGDDGTFVLAENSLHVSVLLQQVVPGSVGDLLAGSMMDLLGLEPVDLDPIDAGDVTFRHLQDETPGSVIDIFIAETDDETYLVLFQHAPADHERAIELLTRPVLEAVGA